MGVGIMRDQTLKRRDLNTTFILGCEGKKESLTQSTDLTNELPEESDHGFFILKKNLISGFRISNGMEKTVGPSLITMTT